LGRGEEAIAHYNQAIALKPDYADALSNSGNVLQKQGALEAAVLAYGRAIALDPAHADALCQSRRGRSQSWAAMTRRWPNYQNLIRVKPDAPQPHYDLAVTLLRMEALGKRLAGIRVAQEIAAGALFPGCVSAGVCKARTSPAKTLLVDAEQGLGDTLHFCRYVAGLEQTGARVVFSAQDALMRLLRHSFPDLEIVPASAPPPAFDVHIPLLSLPLARKQFEIPNKPYLFAEPSLIAQWRTRLEGPGLKIGIAWQGNKSSAADAGRSLVPDAVCSHRAHGKVCA